MPTLRVNYREKMNDRASWTEFHSRLHRVLRSRSLLPKNDRLLLAVSGGQDSLCLARSLLDLQPKWHWEIALVHCDHGWRSDSAANADYVESLALHWQVRCYRETAIVPPKSEAAARQWRYEVFTRIALEEGYNCVATGHTKSDRAETLLYNLIRGAGTDGLQSLTWRRSLFIQCRGERRSPITNREDTINLVRPLLEFTRDETEQFCLDNGIEIWEDETNQDLKYARNRIRHELLPYLRDRFHPGVEETIARTAELLRADVDCLETMAVELCDRCLHKGEGEPANSSSFILQPSSLPLSLDRTLLQTAPLALQRRVMRRILASILPKAPNFEQIEKLTALINAPNRSRSDPFPGGAIAEVQHPNIIIYSSKF